MTPTRRELCDGWYFKESTEPSATAWTPAARVPGTVHNDLINSGRIAEPYIDMNELSVRWVAERSWTYRTNFVSPDMGPQDKADLVFDGLDTLTKVFLNGSMILDSNNMFMSYRVDATQLLEQNPSRENVLEICFDSALVKGREMVKQHQHEHRFIAHQTEQGRLPVRKAQYHWGWDWGSILTTAGIFRPIWLETYSFRIDDVWFRGHISDDLRLVSGRLFATICSAQGTPVDATVQFSFIQDGNLVDSFKAAVGADGLAQCDFEIASPRLWYPQGYGEGPCLYTLTAVLVMNGKESASRSKQIGFRRAELVQERDAYGKSFYFRINNIDIFAGGSNWVPADSLLPNISRERYRKWLQLMVDGNQIMTRQVFILIITVVWGGGIYEDEAFYEACDELGIMVWQDFCFACQSTPTYPSFLKQVDEEARHNIRRLRNRPCLVIWAGNNEDYQIQERYDLDYPFEEDKDPQSWLKSTFPARYIYEHQLPQIVQEEDPGAIYHPSSPWGEGKKTFDPTVGDIHQWNIWHGLQRRYQEAAILGGRFVSEFGMEAYPHISTIEAAISDPGQRYPGSMLMDYRNRAIDHERRLMTYVAENFRIKYDLPSFTHLTQLVQADAMTHTYRAWRRDWGTPAARKCGGVLVWQLNDSWPTMSWAVVDYWLVKKPGFYAIARALKPVAIGISRPFHPWTIGHNNPTLSLTDTSYELWVASSLDRVVAGKIEIRFISIKTGKDICAPVVRESVQIQPNSTTDVIQAGKVDVTMPPLNHEPVDPDNPETFVMNQAGNFRFPTKHREVPPVKPEDFDPFVIYAKVYDGSALISTDTEWPHPLKYFDFPSRNVRVRLSSSRDRAFIAADKPVKGFVFQEKRDWVAFSDNGFDIMPGEETVVDLTGADVRDADLTWTYLGANGIESFQTVP